VITNGLELPKSYIIDRKPECKNDKKKKRKNGDNTVKINGIHLLWFYENLRFLCVFYKCLKPRLGVFYTVRLPSYGYPLKHERVQSILIKWRQDYNAVDM